MVKSTRNAHERVRELLELRRWNSVVEATDEILAAVPNDWWMWAARASALLQLGQSDDALSAAQRATGLSPDAEWPLRLQSMSLRSLGRRRAAIASARRATAVDPTSDAALVELSVAQNLGGRRRTAAATAKAAVGRNPDLLDGWLALGAATTGRRPATAKAAYRRALAIDPNSSAATAALAALSGRGRRRDELNTAAARLDADAHEPRAALLAVDNILSGAAAVFAAAMVAAMVPRPWSILAVVIALTLGAAVMVMLHRRRMRRLEPDARQFVDERWRVDPAITSQLLELCPEAGISVVAAVESDARVPRQAKATFRCVPPHDGALSSVWFTEPKAPSEDFEPEPANARLVDRVAMALAPLRDATSASATAAIPRVVPLLSLFGPEPPTPLSLNATWSAPKPYGLRAPIGMGPSGPLELDLVEHGPHALIGGTSGAGKSELLQSIVAALVHQYPPTRLNFLFVDYKGGAATEVFGVVPHTVGYVTNLDASLSLRALTSLRAELNHRMRLMEGKAKDLAEMIEKYPDEAPPSLVIVVDEFATLVKEVPDFVAGVVDIAQRGRSLGVHLILATQRPSGSVNDNILANTNLRISLRMLDASESKTVIGVGSAAEIPLPLKGRGFAKLGPSDLIEFQSAYTGASLTQEAEVSPVKVQRFGNVPRPGRASSTSRRSRGRTSNGTIAAPTPTLTGQPGPFAEAPPDPIPDPPVLSQPLGATYQGVPPAASQREPPDGEAAAARATTTLPPPIPAATPSGSPTAPAPSPSPPSPPSPPERTGGGGGDADGPSTHLDVLLDAIGKVAPSWPEPRKPWREMLPEVLDLSSVEPPEHTTAPGRKGRYITLGLVDDPAAQAQYPAVFDLEESGGLLIGGSGGSGKTSALRTAAVSAITGATPDEVTLFIFDCASRSLPPLRALPHVAAVATGDDLEAMSRVISILAHELDRRRPLLADVDVQAEDLSAYLDKGHSLPRIVVLIDAFQNLTATFSGLRSADFGPTDYAAELQRVITNGRQLGIHTIMTVDRRQSVPSLLMSAIGDRLVLRQTDDTGYGDFGIPTAISKGIELPNGRGLWGSQLLQVGLVGDQPTAAGQGAAIAEVADSLRTAERTALATSPPPETVTVPPEGSAPGRVPLGRTDTFGELVEISVDHNGLAVVGPPRSGRTTALRQAARSLVASGYDVWTVGLGDDIGGSGRHSPAKSDPVLELLEDFATMCESMPKAKPYILIVDDLDRYEEQKAASTSYERILKTETSRLLASIESRNLSGYTQNTMLTELRREPTMLFLQPESAADLQSSLGIRVQLRPGLKMSAGRGVLVTNRRPVLMQVAVATE